MLRTFGMDDVFMVIAQIVTLGAAVAIGLEGRYGLGSHSWVASVEDYIPYMKARTSSPPSTTRLALTTAQSFYSSIIVYNMATCIVKISILLQYRRIFSGEIMQRLTLCGLVFMGTWTVILSVLLPLMCYPVAAFWDSTVDGVCVDYLAIWYAMAGVNLAADLAIFSMPIPVISSLQLPRRQKRMLLLVFGLGFFTCVISALRIRTLRVAAKSQDPYWDNVDAATWSFLEITVGILAACLPTLRPIFVTFLPRLFAGSSARNGSGRPSNKYGNPHVPDRGASATPWPLNRASRVPGSSVTEGLRNDKEIELGAPETEASAEYTVTVTAGANKPFGGDFGLRSNRGSDERQILTTTVVSQEVTADDSGGQTPLREDR
ncbi:Satratoxin biosynthesis SC1 cluster protein 4 [Colletotrichum orbiculare MAFF 240422]|uniref:Satratoxin biosynthesis SC1 cluster protein 4 n=1 Tax=Colletotrichum orbiculare (strain 104-T / ATCC 96160 / CBS 514.97 / LARS 414 / MAFF 240422) TaxID=1213857 RepID=A0A484FV59_COLOR|nr:Satratoxin biosynthesis SC1 cluster protein 4 [Colletotrichum orbiculare MAFF 240422]